MAEVLRSQLDYIFFLYGLSFILMAVATRSSLLRGKGASLPWGWLGLFGLLHGVHEWLDMAALSLPDPPILCLARTLLLAASFWALIEFSRRGWALKNSHSRPPAWIPLVLLALGGLAGIDGLDAAWRYSLGLPAGVGAAWVLWRAGADRRAPGRSALRTGAAALLVYAAATGLIPPKSDLWPAAWLNQDSFFAATGVPIQLIRMCCAVACMITIWLYGRAAADSAGRGRVLSASLVSAAVTAIIAVGWLGVHWQGASVRDRMREDVQRRAQLLASTIHTDPLAALSFTAADAAKPEFQRLRSQMNAYANWLTDTRRVYLLRRSADGTMAFGPTGVPGSDPAGSIAPGTEYLNPLADLAGRFDSRQPIVLGPYRDERGLFVSSFATVLDPRSGQVLALVGVDETVDRWATLAGSARLAAIGLTLLVASILLAGLSLLQSRRLSPTPQRYWLFRHAEAVLTATLGLGLTTALVFGANQVEAQRTRDDFLQLADARADEIFDTFSNARQELAALARSCRSDGELPALTASRFEMLAGPAAKASVMLAYGWAPRVPASQRDSFERGVRAEGRCDFAIYQCGPIGQHLPAEPRAEYLPVTYVTPAHNNTRAVGLDTLSDPVRRAAIAEALRTGLPVATPTTIMAYDQMGRGVVIYHPVVRNGQPVGLVFFAMRPQLSVAQVFSAEGFNAAAVALSIVDVTDPADPQLLATFPPAQDGQAPAAPPLKQGLGEGYVQPMFLFGRAWIVVVRPNGPFWAAHAQSAGLLAGAGGMLATVLLTILVAYLCRRRAILEACVTERTAELRKSENRLAATLRSIGDGVISTDPAGCVVDLNEVAETLTGWTLAEARGRSVREVFHIVNEATRQEVVNPIWQAIRENRILGLANHTVLVSRSRAEFQIADSCAPIHDGDGQVVGAVLVFRDVTDSHRAQKALVQGEARLKAILQSVEVGVVTIDAAGGLILEANPRAMAMFGGGRDALVGAPCSRFLDPSNLEPDPSAEGGSNSASTESELVRFDGRTVPVLRSTARVSLDGRECLIASFIDITDRKRMEEQLRQAAQCDKLTGLPNRALLMDRLGQALLRSQRLAGYAFAVLFLDCDRFKMVNDSLGHEAGDQLLQEIARRLKHCLRTGDSVAVGLDLQTAARLGGDEFVVLLDGLRATADAQLVADRLINSLDRPYRIGGHEVFSSASVGIVTSGMGHATAADLLRDADTAMYQAKLAGRGRAVLFDPSMRHLAQLQLTLETDLRKAFGQGQFTLHYQPIISLETGLRVGVEALVRWNHPQRGLVPPGEFIPLAEESGLIVRLGEWVLRAACRQWCDWQRDLGEAAPGFVAVNLSRVQLVQPDLIRRIGHILRQTGVDPAAIHLEVTESAVVADMAAAAERLRNLKKLGVKLAMDDFGTGYSSLSCLRQFSLDELKIDRTFVSSMDGGRDFTALVHAIIALAQNLGMTVIAEGVETLDQVTALQALGCPLAQGYFFGKPAPADQAGRYEPGEWKASRRESA
jgi:diguanylate cyclase (GGDEF)-like protein/PAS domain S-box-containing protein